MGFLLDSNPIIYYLNQQLPPEGKAFIDRLLLDGVACAVITRLEVLGTRMLNELVRFLDNQWEPIIATDVDGTQSVPTQLDRENPNFGRVSACKRVARSLYMGTAPFSEP